MANELDLAFTLKVSFLLLFGAASLLFGTVGLAVCALCVLGLVYVVYAHNKQKAPLEGNNQTVQPKLDHKPIYRETSEAVEYDDDEEYEDSTDSDVEEYELNEDN